MKPIFGRITGRPHGGLGEIAAEFLAGGPVEDRAMARNLMHDHRVSEDRAACFYALTGQPDTSDRLKEALSDYLQDWVRKHPARTFLDQDNAVNFVYGWPSLSESLNSDYPLARVLDLTGLKFVLLDGQTWGMPELEEFRFAEAASEDYMNRFLGSELGIASESSREAGIGVVLRALAVSRPGRPFHPVWAASWPAFEGLTRADEPESWLEAVGVPRSSGQRWLIVLRYTAGETGILVRPTQLDGGWFAYHFPSPPPAPPPQGGHAMSLQEATDLRLATGWLVPEFIHAQIDHSIEHCRAAGFLCGLTGRAVGENFLKYRTRQYDFLKGHYGEALIAAWMEDCK